MGYLATTWSYVPQLHQRGIQALLLAGCLLGFGLGQTIGVTYGPHAPHINRASIERSAAAAVATSRAGGSIGNTIAPQQAASTGLHTAPAKAQPQSQIVPLATPTPQPQATNTPDGKQHGKGHHKGHDGNHGNKGNGNGNDGNSPKMKDPQQGQQGGANDQQGQGKGNQQGAAPVNQPGQTSGS